MNNPTEVVHNYTAASDIKEMLDKRYVEWWILDRIIEHGDEKIYYFTSTYVEAEVHAVPVPRIRVR